MSGSWGWGVDPDSNNDGTVDGTDMETDSSSMSFGSLPGVPKVLKNLGGTARDLLKNPKTFIIGVFISWVLRGVLDFVGSIVDLVLQSFRLVAGIPATVGGSFGTAGALLSGSVANLFETITGMATGLISALGWTAPLVAAVVFLAVLEAGDEFGPPILRALSDLLGAIPVVGSILDAALTLLLGLAT
ncbi:MAG: hypothetical protein ABEI57_01720, partial [Halapricum sp.]